MTKNKKIRYENFKLIYREFLKVYPIELTDLDGEIWKDIEDYDGDYQVNNFGRIKSFKNGKVKIRKPYIDKDGYLQIVLSKNGVNKWFKIHRLVAEAFVPNLENKPDIDHIFNNKFDNFAENLRWVTKLENNRKIITKQNLQMNRLFGVNWFINLVIKNLAHEHWLENLE